MILTGECAGCIERVALEAGQNNGTHDNTLHRMVISRMLDVLKKAIFDGVAGCPVGHRMMDVIHEVTGWSDPYKDFKRRKTQESEQLVLTVCEAVEKSSKPLREACKAAAMGNLMDVIAFTASEPLSIDSFLKMLFAVNHFDGFRSTLCSAESVTYLADNAGEVFFDKILIDQIRLQKGDIPIEYFVKDFPFMCDAKYEDAVAAKIGQVATVRAIPFNRQNDMDLGFGLNVHEEFFNIIRQADLVIAKGQANYQLLMSLGINAFCLFVHKCPVIARAEEANIGDAVIVRI
jgi:uncharacterized protein with ATP-grasp and redox domains